jgi:predicted permease
VTPLARMASLWRNLRHKERCERDLEEEIRAYAGILEDEKITAGLPPEEARRQALMEIGGIEQVKEQVREVRMGAWIETVGQDTRFAVRTLLRSPGFTIAAVVALALGIGATTAIFSVVDAVLLRPLPYADPDRLTVVLHGGRDPVAPANYLDWRREASAFTRMGAAEYWQTNLSGGDRPERVLGLHVTADILPLLGVPPLLGRVFAPEEDAAGRDHVVVLGYRIWQRRFGGDPSVVGRTVALDGAAYAVVGVMPRGFEFPPFWATGAELWGPLPLGDRATSRQARSLRVFGRLRDDSSVEKARAEIQTITARLEQAYPASNRDVVVRGLDDTVVGGVRHALLILLGAVGFVLLIACANVAHMLLARGAARRREIALRVALGASRARVVRQLLTESVLLASAGGLLGLGLAAWMIRTIVALSRDSIPRLDTAGVDPRVLAATLAVSFLTGIAFGLVPALQASRLDLGRSLKEGERGSSSGAGRHRLRRLLMGSEMALALVLLVGAGLMIRTFVALRAVDPGFRPDHVLSAVVSVSGSRAGEGDRRVAFYAEALGRIRALPGVTSASAINHLPLAGDSWGEPFSVEGQPPRRPGERPTADYRIVLPGYFETMGRPLVRGRDFDLRDDLGAPNVVIVNAYMAERHWPGLDPIGKRITFSDPAGDPVWLTVVGVARNGARREWAEAAKEELFLPFLQTKYREAPQSWYSYLTLVVRGTGEPAALVSALRAAVWDTDPDVSISAVQTMDEVVARATASPRFYLLLLGSFASVALALAAVGIYGVMSYSVAQRRNEIGIRMALGARPADVLRMVMGEAIGVAAAGAAAGLAAALALTRLMSGLLYGVAATDPATFAGVCGVLSLVALLATFIPARRAVRTDPLDALRSE